MAGKTDVISSARALDGVCSGWGEDGSGCCFWV